MQLPTNIILIYIAQQMRTSGTPDRNPWCQDHLQEQANLQSSFSQGKRYRNDLSDADNMLIIELYFTRKF